MAARRGKFEVTIATRLSDATGQRKHPPVLDMPRLNAGGSWIRGARPC